MFKKLPKFWFALALAIISVQTFQYLISVRNQTEIKSIQTKIEISTNVLVALEDLQIAFLEAERYIAILQFKSNDSTRKKMLGALTNLSNEVDDLEKVDHANFIQDNKLDALLPRIQTYVELHLALLQSDAQGNGVILRPNATAQMFDQFENEFASLLDFQALLRNKYLTRLNAVRDLNETISLLSYLASFFSGLLIIFIAFKLIKQQSSEKVLIENENERLVTAVAQRTNQLELYSKELERSNRELEDFAFVASHDLQEPLRKIRTFGERLQLQYSDSLENKGQEYLKRMHDASERMSKLIQDLLSFSRVNTKTRAFETVELAKTIDEVLDDLSELILDKKTSIQIPSLPNIIADPLQMRQLFYNLINNGIKFSGQEEKPEVSIQYTLIDDHHCIKVCDNGIGLDTQFAEKIFAPFQRLHGKDKFSGTGIGLSICRRIVERHFGRIQVASEEGRGACFTVEIPTQPNIKIQEIEEDYE